MNLIEQYLDLTNENRQEQFKFLVSNRRLLNRQLFREMSLNYRTYYTPDKKTKIVANYKKLIITKESTHSSDLAIGYNILKFVNIAPDCEIEIIEYMYNRLHDVIPQGLSKNLKKHFVLSYIEKNILIKKRS